MKNKMIITVFFAIVLMISMPMISSIKIETKEVKVNEDSKNDCQLCSKIIVSEDLNLKVTYCKFVAAVKTFGIHLINFLTPGMIILIPPGYYYIVYQECMNS